MITVATVQIGHSEFHDEVWTWINAHHHHLANAFTVELEAERYGMEYDYAFALVLFVEAGCSVAPLREEDGGVVYRITYPGSAASLVDRLDQLLNAPRD